MFIRNIGIYLKVHTALLSILADQHRYLCRRENFKYRTDKVRFELYVKKIHWADKKQIQISPEPNFIKIRSKVSEMKDVQGTNSSLIYSTHLVQRTHKIYSPLLYL
jgi:hypothetical protein